MPISVGRLILFIGILMAVAACGDAPDGTTPTTVVTLDDPAMPTATVPQESPSVADGQNNRLHEEEVEVTVEVTHDLRIDTSSIGLALPSVDERIYLSDVVVRATLTSRDSGVLNFRAIEYMKGTGTPTFTIPITSGDRSTRWDNREAVLFLNTSNSAGRDTNVGRSPSASTFQFADTTTWDYEWGYSEASDRVYSGTLPQGNTVASANPVWIPSTTPNSGGSSLTRSHIPNHNPDYITEAGVNPPTISLADIRAKIAWQQGDGSAEYRDCVETALAEDRASRDYVASQGRPGEMREWLTWPATIPSALAGEAVYYGFWGSTDKYARFRLEGKDAELFIHRYEDNDEDPTNGYHVVIRAARPLPSGIYTFTSHVQIDDFFPCNYITPNIFTPWEVTVEAPDGAILESLFDPQTLSSGDGYISSGDVSTGDLSPAAFDVGSTTHTIASLYGTGDSVTLALSPYVDLAGHTLDFITGDGTTSLTLTGDAATGDSTAGTLTWAVSSQPWSSGDQLMLRITEPWFGVRVDLSPREEGSRTLTDITISWADPQTCSDGYFVALYDGDTVVRTLGYPDATTTSISNSTGMQWDSIPSLTSTARVNCMDNNWRLVGDVPLTSGLP